MSGVRRTLALVLLALLGIAVAAAITLGTSQLVRQHIGLSSQPLSAGQKLLPTPPLVPAPSAVASAGRRPRPTTTHTSPTAAPRPVTPSVTAQPAEPAAAAQPAAPAAPQPTPRPTPQPAGGGSGSGSGASGDSVDSSRRRDD